MGKHIMSNRKLAHAVHLALFATGAGLAGVAQAQQSVIEEVLVTGTRIQNANLVASSPITQINSEEFKFSGTTRVEDLLNTYPQMSPSFDSFTVNPTTGFATADLRGLGSNRTLVLVNGHRLQPGGIRSEARDLNQIPAAMIQRVEILTGGASVVYGSDAVAGVVNFILDDRFEGISLDVGYSGYQHNNGNSFMRGLQDQAGFEFPTGSGMDGDTYNIDLALGSAFADGRGHAMAYVTYRENEELRQESRDYSSCALNAAGTACGGSSTSPIPSFFVSGRRFVDGDGNPVNQLVDDGTGNFVPRLDDDGNPIRLVQSVGFTHMQQDGTWTTGTAPLYNYAPINHYQRPDKRYTFGGSMRYEFSPQFQPYIETMFTNTSTSVQIAESGTFFVNALSLPCESFELNTFCDDLSLSVMQQVGVDENGDPVNREVFLDRDVPLTVQVGKRNNEGGPRVANIESESFRFVVGAEGEITENWNYDVALLYGRNTSNETNENDFLTARIGTALLACDASTVNDPSCYNVWRPGGVTPDAAARLGGIGARQGTTELMNVTAYVSGLTDFRAPMANDPVSVVFGVEYREDKFEVRSDTNMAEGAFTGLGGPRPSISGDFNVREFFLEVGVPLVQDQGLLQNLGLDLGYRRSHYNTSGGVNTFKIGATADIGDMVRVRGGFNRAIRAANVGELFATQQIALWGGDDPCAGATPEFTVAQCQNTGLDPSQYGLVEPSPAAQYNQFIGGNADLNPEEADTWTFGIIAQPIDGLTVSIDYFDIEITDRIGTIGAETQLRFCGLTGDPFLCNNIRRNAQTGDLWLGSDPEASGLIVNTNANFGDVTSRGLDFQAIYNWEMLGGMWTANFNGSRALKTEIAPLPGVNPDATFDCAGRINTSCQQPKWRHTARVSYARDKFTGSLRWRYTGELSYKNTDDTLATTDQILVNNGNKLSSWNYFDLTAAYEITENINITAGVNNVFDKTPPIVGSTLSLNANSPGGYDQLGRFIHTRLSMQF
jgi:iron complex outermembrane receptor protein